MAETVEDRLSALGITLPTPTAPAANYVPTVRCGNQLFVSGQLPMADGKLVATGTLGVDVAVEDAAALARLCAINVLAQVKAALGDLGRVVRLVKVTGFVASAQSFGDQPKVMNGASDLFVAALGESGRHARSAVGVAAIFEVG